MSEKEIVTYVGSVGGIEEGQNGRYAISVSVPGKQYPVKLKTKKSEIVVDARQLRDSGQVGTFTVAEWDSDNINPNNNKPYRERWVNTIEAATEPVSSNAGVSAHHEILAGADKDRAISRMACLKAAAQLYEGDASDDPPLLVMKAAQRFETWVYRDLADPPF